MINVFWKNGKVPPFFFFVLSNEKAIFKRGLKCTIPQSTKYNKGKILRGARGSDGGVSFSHSLIQKKKKKKKKSIRIYMVCMYNRVIFIFIFIFIFISNVPQTSPNCGREEHAQNAFAVDDGDDDLRRAA